jgi:transposase
MAGLDLSTVQRTELEYIVRASAVPLRRRARVVLARAEGASLNVIAARLGLHRDTCRRWVVRYRARGVAGLRHGNTGKPKNVVFDAAACGEIRRRARMDPVALGESFPAWSLYKLRDHLVRHHVVRKISVERLRQLLRDAAIDRTHWLYASRRIASLPPETRRQLVRLARDSQPEWARRARVVLAVADGVSIATVASTSHMGKNSVRRWLDYFQLAGVAGLAHGVPTLREAIVRITRVPPRAVGQSGDTWSLPQLRDLLLRRGIAPIIGVDELRRVAQSAGITLAERRDIREHQRAAVGAAAFDGADPLTTTSPVRR